jgi:hypothetical protein
VRKREIYVAKVLFHFFLNTNNTHTHTTLHTQQHIRSLSGLKAACSDRISNKRKGEKTMLTHKTSIFKRIGALLLAMMTFTVLCVSASTTYDKTVSFSNVKSGDTITAYRLVSYDSTYNDYVFETSFASYLGTKKASNITNTQYLTSLKNSEVGSLLNAFAAAAQTVDSGYTLPTAFASATAADNAASLTLEPGYYMILGSTTSTNSQLYAPTCVFVKPQGSSVKVYAGSEGSEITTSLHVAMKTENAPTLDKASKNPNHENETWSTLITGNTDDEAEFRIKVEIPAFSDGTVLNLSVKDTMHNMEYVADSIKVYSDENCTTELSGAIPSTGITVGTYDTAKHDQTLTIPLVYSVVHPTATVSSTVYIYYKAVLHSDAAVNNADAYNTAKLTYSNSTTPDVSYDTEDKTTEADLYDFNLSKVDESGNALAGAKFKVYSSNESTTPIKFSYNSNTTAYYPDKDGTVTEVECDSLGKLHLTGLDVGTYYFEESTVPTGYYAPNGRFQLKLVRGSAKNLLDSTTSFAAVNSADTALISSTTLSDDKYTFSAVLKNSTTPVLPTAGGAGTVMYTAVGILMMALACAMALVYKRKVSVK